MSKSYPTGRSRGQMASWGLVCAVTGGLIAGGAGGLAFTQFLATKRPINQPDESSVAISEPILSEQILPEAPAPRVEAVVRMVHTTAAPAAVRVPPDPFQPAPTAAKAAAPGGEVNVLVPRFYSDQPKKSSRFSVALKPGVGRLTGKPRPVPMDAPGPDELGVTGIVQGDPPLVVVQYEDQSFYLKVGDQVADTWRLEEIKERSAVFQLGEQRVEIPIKGGSSQ
jgi:hypothetical protein